MPDIDYTRTAADAIVVRNNDNEWSITRNGEPPVMLWLRIPDEAGVEPILMTYNWDADEWSAAAV